VRGERSNVKRVLGIRVARKKSVRPKGAPVEKNPSTGWFRKGGKPRNGMNTSAPKRKRSSVHAVKRNNPQKEEYSPPRRRESLGEGRGRKEVSSRSSLAKNLNRK